MRNLVEPLFEFYGYPKHVKTDAQKQEFASVYIFELSKYSIEDLNAVKSHILTNHKFLPKIEQIVAAITQMQSLEAKERNSVRYHDQRGKAYHAEYQLRRQNRADIYRHNTGRIEKIIAKGWGLQIACAISDMFAKAYPRDQHEMLVTDAKCRAHYSPPICRGQDPLYYFEEMPVNHAGLDAMAKRPVQFVKGVTS